MEKLRVEEGDVSLRFERGSVDEVMRRPATGFKGPKDPDLDVVITYIRAIQMKHEKAKRSWFADEINPELWAAAKERRISKPTAYRRF